jgi:hypothetical protein
MKHFKPYLKTIKWILVFVPLMLAPLVFNHINPWIGIVWAILSIVFIAHQIIISLTKNN